MLGKTNLLFVAEDEPTDLSFTPQYILTPASDSIIKIEMINNLFFAYTSDGKVYYGSDMNHLQILKKDGAFMLAKHIIYADGVYYMTNIETTKDKAIIYKTPDLVSYEQLTLKTSNDSWYYPVHGLFLNSAGEIVALVEKNGTSGNYSDKYLLVAESLENYVENSASFIQLENGYKISGTGVHSTTMEKDRIFANVSGGSSISNSGIIITLDGTSISCEKYTHFAADYFFRVGDTATNKKLYYSLNGKDYINIDFSKVDTNFSAKEVFEYDGNIALIYSGSQGTKLALSATPTGLVEAISSAIPVNFDYAIRQNSNLYNDDYVYLGSTGGIVVKAKIDYSDTTRPDITLLKTLSARQALTAANEYTEKLFAALELRVEALEKAEN